MTIYLVRRYVNDMKHDDYGVDDKYSLIGAFTDPAIANKIKEDIEAEINSKKHSFQLKARRRLRRMRENWAKTHPNTPFNEGMAWLEMCHEEPPSSIIDIIEVEVDKQYDVNDEPYLGGGRYIE